MKGMHKKFNRGMALPFALGLLGVLTGLAFTLDATVIRSFRTLQSFEYRCQLRSVLEELIPVVLDNLQRQPSLIKSGTLQLPAHIELPPGIVPSEFSLRENGENAGWIMDISLKRVFGNASVRVGWQIRFVIDQEGVLSIVSIDET